MKKILIFAGTIEGRHLAEHLAKAGVPTYVCVAPEYGEQKIPPAEGLTVFQGGLSGDEMRDFISGQSFAAIVDAVHPYAADVSEQIRNAAEDLGLPYLPLQEQSGEEMKTLYAADTEACVETLKQEEGNLLLMTGSSELSAYCAEKELRDRLYVKVSPRPEDLDICYANGLSENQIIAARGTLSQEMYLAVIRQYQIRCIVTRESGMSDGFAEQMDAARQAGIRAVVIGNPNREDGLSMREILSRLEEMTDTALGQKRTLHISLAGTGMGGDKTMTEEVRQAVDQADLILGEKSLLEEIPEGRQTRSSYLAKDVIASLESYLEETDREQIRVCVLFPGDSGLYSECQSVYEKLQEWGHSGQAAGAGMEVNVHVLPGISSVSYLAARTGIAWQDAAIINLRGREEPGWRTKVLQSAATHRETFVLLSGVEQVRRLGDLLEENNLSRCRVVAGYQLSHRDEMISRVVPAECRQFHEEGLYTCLILNPQWQGRALSSGITDVFFTRGKAPMTKEEVRAASLAKLQLTEGAVVYDIGSGTGSVAAEIGRLSPNLQVYAIEKEAEACSLIRKNCGELGLDQVYLIGREAPECFQGLPAATHAIIEGSGGRLLEILRALSEMNPAMRIVVIANSLETIGECEKALELFSVEEEEIVQLQVARGTWSGDDHKMQGEDPVLIVSFCFSGQGGQ